MRRPGRCSRSPCSWWTRRCRWWFRPGSACSAGWSGGAATPAGSGTGRGRPRPAAYALVAYLTQVSLLRRGGAGVATALAVPARLLDDSWAMRRIADQLELAERGRADALGRAAPVRHQIDLDESPTCPRSPRPPDTTAAAVIDTLLARADSLQRRTARRRPRRGEPGHRADEHPRRAAGLPHRRPGSSTPPPPPCSTPDRPHHHPHDLERAAQQGETDMRHTLATLRLRAALTVTELRVRLAARRRAGRRDRRGPQHRRGLPHRRRRRRRRDHRRRGRRVHRQETRRPRLTPPRPPRRPWLPHSRAHRPSPIRTVRAPTHGPPWGWRAAGSGVARPAWKCADVAAMLAFILAVAQVRCVLRRAAGVDRGARTACTPGAPTRPCHPSRPAATPKRSCAAPPAPPSPHPPSPRNSPTTAPPDGHRVRGRADAWSRAPATGSTSGPSAGSSNSPHDHRHPLRIPPAAAAASPRFGDAPRRSWADILFLARRAAAGSCSGVSAERDGRAGWRGVGGGRDSLRSRWGCCSASGLPGVGWWRV